MRVDLMPEEVKATLEALHRMRRAEPDPDLALMSAIYVIEDAYHLWKSLSKGTKENP